MSSQRILKIILADDDQDDRDLFAEAISDQSAAISSVTNGLQLMKTLSQIELPDMVFIDLNMPEKNGKECLEEIRKQDRFKNVPIIIYSTSSSTKDIEDTFDLGASLYFTKPNSFNELKKMVKNILNIDWNNLKLGMQKENFVFKIS